MAKKKSRAELKEERRRAMERKRRETGWEPPPEPDMDQERLLADMAPLLGAAEEDRMPSDLPMGPFIEMVVDSDDLIEEPEFDRVYVHPFLAVEAFSEWIEELGLEDLESDELSMPEREEARAELMAATTMQVLTEDLQVTILSALEELRERARHEGDPDLVARAAAVHAFLDAADDKMWAHVGVVEAIIDRSLTAGMELHDLVEEEAEREAADRASPGLLRGMVRATPGQRMDHVIAKYPGLAEFLEERLQQDWEEGADALASGDLILGLFSEAERSAALAEAASWGIQLTGQGGFLVPERGSSQDAVGSFVARLRSYLEELVTAERLAQMQTRVDEFAVDADPAWLTFLSILSTELEQGKASQHLHYMLVHALLGEMQKSVRRKIEGQ